ncbi:MAG: hypothetical protein MI743_22470 [Sneathiellales bacterium]|nr:hypothetical protein [Sneathiellales bacterium]
MRIKHFGFKSLLEVSVMLPVLLLMLTSCMAGKRDPQGLSAEIEDHVSFQTAKEMLLFSKSGERDAYWSSSGKGLDEELNRLTGRELYQIRLRAKTPLQQKRLETRLEDVFRSAGKTAPFTSGPLLAADSPYTASLEIYYPVLRIADCHKGDSFARPGCVIAVNRALSLKYPEELQQGKALSSPSGAYVSRALGSLRQGKQADLPALSQERHGYGSD